MNPSSPTAILLFTRTPEEEAQHKTFVSASRPINRRIAQQLINHTFTCIENAGIPVYVINSHQQRGSTFGERLAAAFQDVFEEGYQNVIAVGNDTLALTARDIQLAANHLEHNQAVIGPTHRGGAYLIGLCQSVFSCIDFTDLPWETDLLFESLLQELPEDCVLLKYERDINDATDFYAVLTEIPQQSTLYKTLQNILSIRTIRRMVDRPRIATKHFLRYYSHRAPPRLLLSF